MLMMKKHKDGIPLETANSRKSRIHSLSEKQTDAFSARANASAIDDDIRTYLLSTDKNRVVCGMLDTNPPSREHSGPFPLGKPFVQAPSVIWYARQEKHCR